MATEVHKPITGDELAHTFEEAAPEADLSVYAIEDWFTLALFWFMALAVFLQFFTRYVLNDSYGWTEEIATYCLVVIVFWGSALCVRLSRHIQVDLLFRFLPPRPARVLSTAVDVVRTAFLAYATYLVWRFSWIVFDERMVTLNLSKSGVYVAVLVGFALMFARSAQISVLNWRRGYSVLERPQAFDSLVS
jgi:TRAP-type C4-dicarboxylate transport system permease small subunit